MNSAISVANCCYWVTRKYLNYEYGQLSMFFRYLCVLLNSTRCLCISLKLRQRGHFPVSKFFPEDRMRWNCIIWCFSHVKWSFTFPIDTKYQLNANTNECMWQTNWPSVSMKWTASNQIQTFLRFGRYNCNSEYKITSNVMVKRKVFLWLSVFTSVYLIFVYDSNNFPLLTEKYGVRSSVRPNLVGKWIYSHKTPSHLTGAKTLRKLSHRFERGQLRDSVSRVFFCLFMHN